MAVARRRDLLGDIFRSILPLQGFLDEVELRSLDDCVYNAEPGSCLADCNLAEIEVDLRMPSRLTLASICTATLEIAADSPLLRLLPPELNGLASVHYAAALILSTMEGPFPFYKLITKPLNVSGARSRDSLRCQERYLKLLLVSIRVIPKDSVYWYTGVVHRGVSVAGNPLLLAKYNDYRNAFAPGTKITFAAPTSATVDADAAASFEGGGGGIRYVIQGATPNSGPGGVRLNVGDLSVYDESEVLLEAPLVISFYPWL